MADARSWGRAAAAVVCLLVCSTAAVVATAQDAPVGPCSPYRAADGDIPSEMPGCARHRRLEPGSLDDELRFRRARRGVEADDAQAPDEDAPPHDRSRRRRAR